MSPPGRPKGKYRRAQLEGTPVSPVIVRCDGPIWAVTLNRPEARNAVDGETARLLAQAFRDFDANEEACVALLQGAGGQFCAGADLKAVAGGFAPDGSTASRANPLNAGMDADGPVGPTRLAFA